MPNTESSFGAIFTGSTSPTSRPKNIVAQKRGLGESEKVAGSSMTAASARPGLPVPHSSTSFSSNYDTGLSSAASTRSDSSSDGLGQYIDRRLDSLDHLSPNEGVGRVTSLIDMDFICLYRSGRIVQVYRLLEQLASSRYLLRSDLASALLVTVRHEVALELAQDTGMAENGGSIVLADDEIGLVVTIQLHTDGFHVKYWRTSSVGGNVVFEIYSRSTLGVSTHDATTAMDYDVEASLKRSVHSNQPERVSHSFLCQGTCKDASDRDMNLQTWAFFVLGLGLIALVLGLQSVSSSKKVLWRYSAVSRRSPRGHWHRRRSFGLVQKRMIYALPFLIVLVAEISAKSAGGNQDGASHEASFVSRLSSQLASVLPGSLSEKLPSGNVLDDQTAELDMGPNTGTDDDVAVSSINLSEI